MSKAAELTFDSWVLQFVNLMALMAAWVYIFDTIQKEREALEFPERDVYAEAEAGQAPGQVTCNFRILTTQRTACSAVLEAGHGVDGSPGAAHGFVGTSWLLRLQVAEQQQGAAESEGAGHAVRPPLEEDVPNVYGGVTGTTCSKLGLARAMPVCAPHHV